MSDACQLCANTEDISQHTVEPDASITVCRTCAPQLAVGAELDATHWFCLQESIWSEVPAVQVVSYRLLKRLTAHSWAADLLDQAYLADDVREWAESDGGEDSGGSVTPTVDSNGAVLSEGDSVTLIKDLDVKGGGFTAKRGTLVKNIHLTDNPLHIEGKVNKVSIVLVTAYLKKA